MRWNPLKSCVGKFTVRPTRVRDLPRFKKRLGRLERKYPKTIDEVESLIAILAQGERPGQLVPGVGYTVYKARLPNRAAGRGKSGGFRVIYSVIRSRPYVPDHLHEVASDPPAFLAPMSAGHLELSALQE